MNPHKSKVIWGLLAIAATCLNLSCTKHRLITRDLNSPKYACSITAMLSIDGPEAARRCHAFLSDDIKLSVGQKYLLAETLDAQGEPTRAFSLYKEVILTAHKKEKYAPEAMAASMSLVAGRGRVTRFDASFIEFWAEITGQDGQLPAPAWYQLKNLHTSILRKRGEIQKAAKAQSTLGCVTAWKTAGPFGPHVWSGFDRLHLLETQDKWPKTVELGPGYKPSEVMDARVTQCNVMPGDPRVEAQGTTVNRTKLRLDKRSTVFFRLQTGLAASLLIDGTEIIRRDPRLEHPAYVQWVQVNLKAGVHSLSLKLSGTNPGGQFSLIALNGHGTPAFKETHFKDRITGSLISEETTRLNPVDENAASVISSIRAALWWDDHPALATLWDSIQGVSQMSPVLLSLLAETRFIDQSLPGDLAYEEARSLYERALSMETRLVFARLKLSDHAASEGRTDESIKLLAGGLHLSPREPEYLSRLAGLYLAEGWYPEARKTIGKLETLLPDSCDAKLWKLALARSLGRAAKSKTLAEEIYQCDRLSTELLDEQTRSLKLSVAKKTASELIEMFPSAPSFRERKSYLEMARGNLVGVGRFIREALSLDPKDADLYLRLADSQWARGDKASARATLTEAVIAAPKPSAPLLRARAHLMGQDYMADYRMDGLALIKNYQSDPQNYKAASVYVLDRAIYLYDNDGSNIVLVHTIMHLTSDEAVEAHGEVQIPQNAEPLLARTIKPDGRILEPDGIVGKPTLSLPNIVPGDFIEVEYIAYNEANLTYPGGFDSQRFFFQDFQTAFHYSQIVIVVPKNMKVTRDLRGPCPNVSVSNKGRYKIYTWQAEHNLPHIEEPFGPDPTEYLPSTRVVSRVSLQKIVERVKDMMADKSVPSRIAPQIVGSVCPDTSDKKDCRRRLYHWVLSEIEQSGDPFEQASHTLHRRAGDRNRTFEYLLGHIGDKPRLALVQSLTSDQTENAVPSIDQFSHTALYLPDEGWLSLDLEDAPFGYLAPQFRSQKAVFIDTGDVSNTGRVPAQGDLQQVAIHVSEPTHGETKIRVTETLRGAIAANWRTILKDGSRENILKVFAEQYLSVEIPGAILEDLQIDNLSLPDSDLILTYQVSSPGYLTPRDQTFIGRDLFATGLLKSTGALPSRTTDLVMPVQLVKEVEVLIDRKAFSEIELPYPSQDSVSSKWGTLETSVTSSENTTGYRYKLTLDIMRIPAIDYLQFASFAKDVDARTKIEPVFVPLKSGIMPR